MPTISFYEVFKRLLRDRGETEAARHVALMTGARIVDLDAPLAVRAAQLSLETSLPMADAIILATTRVFEATLWTQDADFEGIEGVKYVARQ